MAVRDPDHRVPPTALRRLVSSVQRSWRAFWAVLDIALTVSAIALPVVVSLVTGSVGLLVLIFAAEGLLGLLAPYVARSLGLPAWSANESYLRRLRRWRAERRAGVEDSPFSQPS